MRRAFTLTEMLVGILISFLLVGGLIATFNAVNLGVKNASRSNDLTQITRNVFNLLNADLTSAGRGISDLGAYQIHFGHSLKTNDEPFFFGIVGQPELNGSSQVIFQWFEYDMLGSPTYVVTNVNGGGLSDGDPWGSPPSSVELVTNFIDDPAMSELGEGDIFLLYNPELMYNKPDIHEKIYTEINGDYTWNEVALNNGAMILQATSVEVDGPNGIAKVSFGEGKSFLTGFNPPENAYSQMTGTMEQAMTAALADAKSGSSANGTPNQVKPPVNAWLARKLSSGEGFRRVRYFLNPDNALIRRDESLGQPEDMVVATNVEEFDFFVGTDVVNPLAQSDPNEWDNAVAITDDASWLGAANTTQEVVRIGRHAVAAQMRITVKSLIRNVQAETEDTYKTRTFEKNWRLRNNHTPLPTY